MSLMPTTSRSGKSWIAARNTIRPIRPKPLMPIFVMESSASAGGSRIAQGGERGLELLGQGVPVDPELARRGTLVAIVLGQHRLQVRTLELPLGHVEGDAFPDHFHDEVMQQLAHRKAPGVTEHVSIVAGTRADGFFEEALPRLRKRLWNSCGTSGGEHA